MFSLWHRLLARLGRWPRRLAALTCLLLAGVTALAPTPAAPSPARRVPGLGLRTGEVAVPVPVQSGAVTRYVHRGDRVGVLYSPADDDVGRPSLVADGLRVLSIDTVSDYGADAVTTVLLATDRTVAVRLAGFAGGELHLLVDRNP